MQTLDAIKALAASALTVIIGASAVNSLLWGEFGQAGIALMGTALAWEVTARCWEVG